MGIDWHKPVTRARILDRRVRVLGVFVLACWLFQVVRYLALEQPGNLLWLCHVNALLLGVGLLASLVSVVRFTSVWALAGVPVWLADIALHGEMTRVSLLSHTVVPLVAAVALWQVRWAPGLFVPAMAYMLALQLVARLFTAPELNVNVAHAAHALDGVPMTASFGEFWAATTALQALIVLAVLAVVRWVAPPVRPPPSDDEVDARRSS